MCVQSRRGFVLESETKTSGIPYADSFKTKIQFIVTALKPTRCHFRISGCVEWIGKPPFVKGFIQNEVNKGQKKAFAKYFTILETQFLGGRKRKVTKDEESLTVEEKQPSYYKNRWLLLAIVVVLLGILFSNSVTWMA